MAYDDMRTALKNDIQGTGQNREPGDRAPEPSSPGASSLMGKDRVRQLRKAMDYSRRRLRPFRRHQYEALRQLVGAHYSDDGTTDRVPVNLIELAANIYTAQLASRSPRALVTTPHMQLKASALDLELALNHLSEEINLEDTLRKVSRNSLFSIGIVKIGLTAKAEVEVDGFLHDPGQPFVDVVDLDDWVHDMAARSWEECDFMGNKYRLPLEYVRDSPLFDEAERKKIGPTSKAVYSTHSEGGDERAESLSKTRGTDPDEFRQHVELWDIWLPKENLIVTIPAEGEGGAVLRTVEWDGPEEGPYIILTYNDVPGNVMPMPPVASWMDLHQLGNVAYRKLGRQVERQKTILGVAGPATEDGSRIIRANDGDTIRLDNPGLASEFHFGGADQASMAFTIDLFNRFSYFAGNLDSLGGLGSQAETLGQEEIIKQSSSQRMQDMQGRMIRFTQKIIKGLAWYLWTDPLIEIPLVKRIPEYDIEVPITWSAEQREGDFLDYNFSIQPYSLQRQTPGGQLQAIQQIFTQFLIPLAPMMESQNMAINFEGFLRVVSRYMNMPELEEFVTFLGEPSGQQPVGGGGGGEMRQSPVTSRNYTRQNIPGASQQGADQAMVAQLLGGAGAAQPAMGATITRPNA